MAADTKGKPKPVVGKPKRKAYYAAQFARTELNRKRRMRRHIRANPYDGKARSLYTLKNFGAADALGVSARGRKLWRDAQ